MIISDIADFSKSLLPILNSRETFFKRRDPIGQVLDLCSDIREFQISVLTVFSELVIQVVGTLVDTSRVLHQSVSLCKAVSEWESASARMSDQYQGRLVCCWPIFGMARCRYEEGMGIGIGIYTSGERSLPRCERS
jgi:hypothetical protein